MPPRIGFRKSEKWNPGRHRRTRRTMDTYKANRSCSCWLPTLAINMWTRWTRLFGYMQASAWSDHTADECLLVPRRSSTAERASAGQSRSSSAAASVATNRLMVLIGLSQHGSCMGQRAESPHPSHPLVWMMFAEEKACVASSSGDTATGLERHGFEAVNGHTTSPF